MTEVEPIYSALAVRDEEVDSAIDAAKNTALLEDVLKANGEEHLYDKIVELSAHVEDEPSVIFCWQNVEVFVQAIQAAQAQAVAPGGLPLPANPLALPGAVNVQNFKEAVLEYARAQGAAARLDTTCLPCSQGQFGQVAFMLQRLELDPWVQRIIAVGVPADRTRLRATSKFEYPRQSHTAISE
ncbi:hypothetical protein PR001_g28162 [Phytophthora rubi]|uniref:Uncharacterized protein n=1 Tax=Phytophthora rubi TaxID=129364 RepID=A0A6A3H953_9STRA|nr:hypothetical protein PR002_g28431 [Phytophthora rubi]KAE8967244.1 hypothetical protein PR001_g28162 [Phytophthora rubi]